MSTITPDRIVELWPNLSHEVRRRLVELAESSAERDLELTAEEEKMLAEGRDDFANGRSLSLEEFKCDIDDYMAELKAGKRPPP